MATLTPRTGHIDQGCCRFVALNDTTKIELIAMKFSYRSFASLIFLVSSFWGDGGFVTAEVRGAQLDSKDESPPVSAGEWRKLTYHYQGMGTKGMKSSRKPFYYGDMPGKKVINSKGAL